MSAKKEEFKKMVSEIRARYKDASAGIAELERQERLAQDMGGGSLWGVSRLKVGDRFRFLPDSLPTPGAKILSAPGEYTRISLDDIFIFMDITTGGWDSLVLTAIRDMTKIRIPDIPPLERVIFYGNEGTKKIIMPDYSEFEIPSEVLQRLENPSWALIRPFAVRTQEPDPERLYAEHWGLRKNS